MPADIWYGADCEMRIGRRADKDTAPTVWQRFEFMSFTANPNQEWRERPKLGAPGSRHNSLDPIAPRKAFFRLGAEMVVDADSRALPLILRMALGAPVSAENGDNAELTDHVWESGSKSETYFDIQISVGANDVRIFEQLTLNTLSAQYGGENTQDFDINLGLMGLNRRKATAFEGDAPTALPTEAPILRGLFEVDDVAASNMLQASWSFSRSIQEGVFLSPTPTISHLRPGRGSGGSQSPYSGSCQFRAVGKAFDDIEEAGAELKAALVMLGVEEDHRIRLENPTAQLSASPVSVPGPGEMERTFSWGGHQTSTTPAARIVVTNDVGAYA